MRVVVVGAGIGGLSAALALRQAGFDVHVYEQATVLREVGAGLALMPNAARVLHRLGLTAALRSAGVAPLSHDTRDWQTGALLGRIPLADEAVVRWGAPFYNMHRADLHDALRTALGDQHMTLGTRCVAVEQHANTVTVYFDDGREAAGDLVIGADGIHSTVREYVAGPDQSTWSRHIAWRGLVPAAVGHKLDLDVRHHSFSGLRKQFVCYYVSAGRLVNWVGHTQSDDDWQEESWSARGSNEDAMKLFAGWHPQVQALIEATERVFKWALFDRPPLTTWTRGRVALLGDAAHPMLPYLGQGAGQTIEDAFVLAHCLGGDREDPQRAIETYADRRRERAGAVQVATRESGRLMQLADPAEVMARNARLSENPEAPAARFDWIWRYDVEAAMADAEGVTG